MKALYSELNSLLPGFQTSREPSTVADQLDEAANYIKKLQVKVEKMKGRKRKLEGLERRDPVCSGSRESSGVGPIIEIHEVGPILNIVLVTGFHHKFLFYDILRLLTDEGTDIVHSSFSVADDTAFHTLQCEVEEYGYGAGGRISERLKRLVNNVSN
ncbi:PREDICTED: transcription factor bHLH36-like isoform X2 [Tarenaya hassleriana]|nr:PREDICTED: transcription factor bHLH36-like isoform X2 [Tarenaya hassleriana]